MGKFEDITKAVQQLKADELRKFLAWVEEFEEQLFDEAIAKGQKSGDLDKLFEVAKSDVAAGRVRDL